MAFPVVEGTAISAQSTSSDPNGISLPAGVQAGDLLLVIYEVSNPVSITFPAGWTVFFTQVGGSFGGVLCNQILAYKKAVGGETSINVSPGAARGYAANAYRISGVLNPAIQPPEAVGTGGEDALPPTGSSDPPPLSPTGGSKDYLWITGYASSASNSTVPPANYGNQILIATEVIRVRRVGHARVRAVRRQTIDRRRDRAQNQRIDVRIDHHRTGIDEGVLGHRQQQRIDQTTAHHVHELRLVGKRQ